MKKKHGLWFGFAILFGAAVCIGGCETGGGGESVTYTSTAGGKTYTLVVYEGGGRAAYTPQTGDRYELTITPDNTRSVGAVASVTGATLTLKPSNATATFTVTTTVTAEGRGTIASLTGTVTLESGKTQQVTISTGGGSSSGGGGGTIVYPGDNGGKPKGRFVAVSVDSHVIHQARGQAAYSTDGGRTWTVVNISLPSSLSNVGGWWSDVAYGDGTFVTGGFYSTDGGLTWKGNNPTNYYICVTYGSGKFVAAGETSSVAYSIDGGKTWIEKTLPYDQCAWYDIIFADGKFVAVGVDYNESQGHAIYSIDGIEWTAVEILDPAYRWGGVTYGNGKFIVVSMAKVAAYSSDGINWIQTALPAEAEWLDVTYGNGMFVAVGLQSSVDAGESDWSYRGIAAYSTDGVTWREGVLPGGDPEYSNNNIPLRGVTYGDGTFVAVEYDVIHGDSIHMEDGYDDGYDGGKIIYSNDGITWKKATIPDTDAMWFGVAYDDYEE
jgi:polyisoprenoid-binding protein YceI